MQITDRAHELAIAGLRIVVGVIFLWAGLEKLLAPEPFSAAGFLQFGTGGSLGWPFVSGAVAEGTIFNPTHDFWAGMATNDAAMGFVNFLVPFGQIGIGVSLILGLLTRFGAAMGTLMMLLFFVAAWEFEFGIVNQHLTYALVTAFLGYIGAGSYFGLDREVGSRASPGIRRWLLSGDPRQPPGSLAEPALA
jgi:thiosulfate dehydrogenase [quinone] large subunit